MRIAVRLRFAGCFLSYRKLRFFTGLKKQESIEHMLDKLLYEDDAKTTRLEDIKTFCTNLVIRQVISLIPLMSEGTRGVE